MKTPYEKYEVAQKRAWEKFKLTVRDICTHPEEYVTNTYYCNVDEYGCTDYNHGTTAYDCRYCGKTWYIET